MDEIRFVALGALKSAEYQNFLEIEQYEKDHPLHMLYDYIRQYYGGLREDVLLMLCDENKRDRLYKAIGKDQEPGMKNEWYRRMVRLLQCNAEPGWYELYCIEDEKPEGYRQYYFNQLAAYAELGLSAGQVANVYRECEAAYLLEFRIRQMAKEAKLPEKVEFDSREEKTVIKEQNEIIKEPVLQEQTELLTSVLKGQEQIREMLESVLMKSPEEDVKQEEREAINKTDEVVLDIPEEKEAWEETAAQPEAEKNQEPELPQAETLKETQMKQEREKAFKMASLFQQIRLKRKTVRLRKMEPKQQIQELALLMKNKNYSPEEIKVVRNLMNLDVSMEFLYTIISEETESVTQLRQMYEFISYQPAEE